MASCWAAAATSACARAIPCGSLVPAPRSTPSPPTTSLPIASSSPPLLASSPRPSVETPMHLAAYHARPEARVVVHCHPVQVIAWAMQKPRASRLHPGLRHPPRRFRPHPSLPPARLRDIGNRRRPHPGWVYGSPFEQSRRVGHRQNGRSGAVTSPAHRRNRAYVLVSSSRWQTPTPTSRSNRRNPRRLRQKALRIP